MNNLFSTIQSADPWAEYDARKGKGKGKGVVPEPATYGLVLVGIVLITVILARLDKSVHNKNP